MTPEEALSQVVRFVITDGQQGVTKEQAKLSLIKLIEEALPKPLYGAEDFKVSADSSPNETWVGGVHHGHNSCLSQVRDGIRGLFK